MTRRTFILDLGLFEPRCGSVDDSEEIMMDLLRILVFANERVLACDARVPPLYKSGVKYISEPKNKEIFMSIPAILRERGADCEDLAAWRVAELRMLGERAIDPRDQFRVLKMVAPTGGLLYHVQVQRLLSSGDGHWYKGPVEDPALNLGMGTAAQLAADGVFT